MNVLSDLIISLQTQIYKIINDLNNNVSIETILIENSSYSYDMLKFIKSKDRLFFEIWFNTLPHFINILEYDMKTFIDTHARYTDFNIQFAEYVAKYIYKNLINIDHESVSSQSVVNSTDTDSEDDERPHNGINIVSVEELFNKNLKKSKIIYCKIDNTVLDIKKYNRLILHIYNLLDTQFILKNSVLNISNQKLNDRGFTYFENLGISIQGVESRKALIECINMCKISGFNMELKIRLHDNSIVHYVL